MSLVSFDLIVAVDIVRPCGGSGTFTAMGTESSRASVSDEPSDCQVVSSVLPTLSEIRMFSHSVTVLSLDFSAAFIVVRKQRLKDASSDLLFRGLELFHELFRPSAPRGLLLQQFLAALLQLRTSLREPVHGR